MSTAWGAANTEVEALREQLEKYEQRLENLERNNRINRSFISRLEDRFRTRMQRLHLNGFMSYGMATLDEENVSFGTTKIEDSSDFHADTVFALQARFELENHIHVLGLLKTKGVTNDGRYDAGLEMDAFYLDYRFNDAVNVQAGRVRIPFYHYSEYLQVGYAYPWVRPPLEIYDAIPTDQMHGIRLMYRRPLEEGDFFARLYSGESIDTGTVSVFDAERLNGLSMEYRRDRWSLSASYTQSYADVELVDESAQQIQTLLLSLGQPGFVPEHDNFVEFFGATASYDDAEWLMIAEYGRADYGGLFPDTTGSYVLVGKYFYSKYGSFLTHLTRAQARSRDNDLRNEAAAVLSGAGFDQAAQGLQLLSTKNTSYILGLRWNLENGMALKLEAQWVTDLDDTLGPFDLQNTSDPRIGDDIWIYSFTLDATF